MCCPPCVIDAIGSPSLTLRQPYHPSPFSFSLLNPLVPPYLPSVRYCVTLPYPGGAFFSLNESSKSPARHVTSISTSSEENMHNHGPQSSGTATDNCLEPTRIFRPSTDGKADVGGMLPHLISGRRLITDPSMCWMPCQGWMSRRRVLLPTKTMLQATAAASTRAGLVLVLTFTVR